jgi:uncharacterized protein YjbI with pentapeptide repeats
MPSDEGRFGTTAKIFSMVAVFVSAISLGVTFINYKAQRQIADRIWRSNLIATIYETKDCPEANVKEKTGKDKDCKSSPRASFRSRAEAIQAYIALQAEYHLKIDLSSTLLSKIIFQDDKQADFTYADFSDSTMQRVTFTGEASSRADLSHAIFNDADLAGAIMVNVDLVDVKLKSANLQGADLTGAKLHGADLSKAILGDCKNYDAATNEDHSTKLKGVIFGNAILDGTYLCGVDLSGLDLSEVQNLSLDQLKTVKGDKDTKLPKYLPSRPAHWET